MNFQTVFENLRSNPSINTLETFTTQMEMMAKMESRDETKRNLLVFFRDFRQNPIFDTIRTNETILRMYRLLGRVSQKMGATKIYEQLELQGDFVNSLQFHLQWAEEYAKTGDVKNFEHVLDLSRSRFKNTLSISNIEAGFRDLADEYLNSEEVDRLFIDPDDTMNVFIVGSKNKTKARRRSSVTVLRQTAPVRNYNDDLFGPKTKTLIRPEFIDTPDRYGVSPEEFRVALFDDDTGNHKDIDNALEKDIRNKRRKDSGIVKISTQIDDEESKKTIEIVENRTRETKRKQLSIVDEEKNTSDEKTESEFEKRARFISPKIKTDDVEKVPLRNSSQFNENPPVTITLSSDTKISTVDDISFDSHKKCDNFDISQTDERKLKKMKLGRKKQEFNEESLTKNSNVSTSSTRNNDGLALMAENNCLEAHAMFSDTVHLARDKTLVNENETEFEPSVVNEFHPNPNNAPEYSILCDPDPTTIIDEPAKPRPPSSGGLNIIYDEELNKKEEQRAQLEEKLRSSIESKTVTPPSFNSNNHYDFFEDEMTQSFRPNVLTSTPAVGVPFVRVEEYFGVENVETKPQKEDVFVIPDSTTMLGKRMNRKSSIMPQNVFETSTSIKPAKDESISEQLGRRLSLGPNDIPKTAETENDIFEETGRKDRRRSEMIKGDLNPWDLELRRRLMALVRPPTNMHEFPTQFIKVQAMKQVEVGGEKYDIRTVLGQGGYAKVYKAINEEKEIVAVKCETPSCAWEVYICDQLRNRLCKKGGEEAMRIADLCVMQVIDAYIFSNSSLLVNQYHEYGTLLDNANNTKDPNWHITCFLVLQMAKILKEIHSTQIIHADVKPDNFMITRKINLSWQKDELITSDAYVIKLIDFGRAIDMATLPGRTFKGRAGTESFDCPEMIDERPWNYQADYFGFAATMALVATGKYANLKGSKLGSYTLDIDIKRRNSLRDVIFKTINKFLNIPSSLDLPSWDETINDLTEVWNDLFDVSAWKQAAIKFNEACEKAKI